MELCLSQKDCSIQAVGSCLSAARARVAAPSSASAISSLNSFLTALSKSAGCWVRMTYTSIHSGSGIAIGLTTGTFQESVLQMVRVLQCKAVGNLLLQKGRT